MTRSLCFVLFAAVSLAACSSDVAPDAFHVVLLGDDSRLELLAELTARKPDGVAFSAPPSSDSAMDVADHAATADFALIVTDAAVGPTPIVREHIILARQLRIPTVALALARTDELLSVMDGDRDLHELVELEVREVMQTYDLAGNAAPRFYDSDTFEPSAGIGALIAQLDSGRFPARPLHTPSTMSGTTLVSEIYLLSQPEAPGVQPISPGSPVSIWIDGRRMSGEADVAAPIRPGDATQLRIRLTSDLSSTPGERFFIESQYQLVGVGTLIGLE